MLITEIDLDKYYVLKVDDCYKYLSKEEYNIFCKCILKVDGERKIKENKPINKYLVLNMDDFINLEYLDNYFREKFRLLGKDKLYKSVKIEKIAVHIINAILKAK